MIFTQKKQNSRGFTLLLAIIVSSIALAIGITIANLTLKQFLLSGVSRDSEMAFSAANAAVECLRYYDISLADGNTFDVPGDGSAQAEVANIQCFGQALNNLESEAVSGDEQRFQATWGTQNTCTDFSIYKFYSTSGDEDINVDGVSAGTCPEGAECTVIKARGYNRSCNSLTGSRVVERELTLVY